jgi:hypothetical protein
MPVGVLAATRRRLIKLISDERYARTDRKFIV